MRSAGFSLALRFFTFGAGGGGGGGGSHPLGDGDGGDVGTLPQPPPAGGGDGDVPGTDSGPDSIRGGGPGGSGGPAFSFSFFLWENWENLGTPNIPERSQSGLGQPLPSTSFWPTVVPVPVRPKAV